MPTPQVVTKQEELEKRGGAYYSEAAVQLVHALTSGGPAEEHVVNTTAPCRSCPTTP
jgi:6-phospho-beta-glucosidase